MDNKDNWDSSRFNTNSVREKDEEKIKDSGSFGDDGIIALGLPGKKGRNRFGNGTAGFRR